MKFKSTVLALVLVVSLPFASSSFAMQANQEPAPNIMGMFTNVIDFMKRHEALSWFAGGLAAFVAYEIMTHTSGKKPVRKKNVPNSGRPAASANPKIQQGVAFLVQHAQQAAQLFQEGKLPTAYLYGKYCQIAKQVGFDTLPHAQQETLKSAVLGYDFAFKGYDSVAKKKVGLEAAFQKAATRLDAVLRQLVAQQGGAQTPADNRSEPRAKSTNPATGIFQALMDQFKANPIQIIGLILSSGYGLLAQFYGWPPYAPVAPKAAPATQPNPAPAPQAP